MNDIIIVDNAAYSFAYQIDNGVPIISWDKHDSELLKMIDYLKVLAQVPDMVQTNSQYSHRKKTWILIMFKDCLLYTSDAADE